MSFKQKDVEKFEREWDFAVKHLTAMAENPILDDQMYRGLNDRIRSLELCVLDISSYVRSDKD